MQATSCDKEDIASSRTTASSLCVVVTMLRCRDTRKAYERYLVLGRLAVCSNNYYEDILKDIECVARSLYYLERTLLETSTIVSATTIL